MSKHSLKKRFRRTMGEGDNPSLLDARTGSGYEAQLMCAGGNRPRFLVDVYRQGTGELVKRFEFQTRDFRNARDFLVQVTDGYYTL
jgi:hypothetical protein